MRRSPRSIRRASMTPAWSWPLATALALAGCGDSTPADPEACAPGEAALPDGTCRPAEPPPDTGCAPGELTLPSGACQPAGLPPDMPCPPGELALPDGTCQAAGVPPEACGDGFEPDGDGGCNAILPAEPCPPGQMAIPGETACREVAPCGDAPWGTIAVEANTQFVDQAYAGGGSDGSAAKPWTTVQQGVDAAEDGAIVAVTDGAYAEDVLIQGKAVRLWGRCPGLVEIQGAGMEPAAVNVLSAAASGAEIRGLSLTGPGFGIGVSGATDVGMEQVRVHDTERRGIVVDDGNGPTSFRLTGSLVEQGQEAGVALLGADATIDATVIRGTQSNANGMGGAGIALVGDPMTSARGSLSVRASLVDQNRDAGLFVHGSDATIEATVIRATQPAGNGQGGAGIVGLMDPSLRARAGVSVRASLIEQNHDTGLLILGSDVTLEATVIRATQPRGDGQGGAGVVGLADRSTSARAGVSVRASLIEQNHEVGLVAVGSDATLEAVIVRSTRASANEGTGVGIVAQDEIDTMNRASLAVRASLVEENEQGGVLVDGSDATLEATVVRATRIGPDAPYGIGVIVLKDDTTLARADATLRACLIEENHAMGVAVAGSDVTLEATVVRATRLDALGQYGTGVQIQSVTEVSDPSSARIRACLVEQNHNVGITVFGSSATIEGTIVRDTEENDLGYGDGISVSAGEASIQDCLVTSNARAGVASFGSPVEIRSTEITCNAFDLNGESVEGVRPTFDGSSGWACSRRGAEDCAETDSCHMISAGLEPPPLVTGL